ncbi:histidine kinase [Proteobacteria bacterium 005FR1]|nr:histidine kinase [Proteobacteria bacterium 005FR1]
MRYQEFTSLLQNTSRQQATGFGLLVLLLILNAGLSYYATAELIEREGRVQGTLNFLMALKDTFSALQDAETGQRGFLITGEEKYLEPYEAGLTSIDAYIAILTTLQSEVPEQRTNIQNLITLIARKQDEMERVVGLRKSDLDRAAFSAERSDRGYRLMEDIRDLVKSMEQLEYNLMSEQRHEAAQSRRQVMFAIAVATFTSLLLIGAVYVLIQRAIRRQQEDAEKLALTNEELELIVSERTLALERYSQELQRSNRELQDFAFIASHDLQEPLRKIRAFGDRLKSKLSPQPRNDSTVDYVNRMQSAAERMSLLITDLLEFSRASTRPAEFDIISLQRVLEEVLDDLSEAIAQKNAEIIADPMPQLEADATQMRQLFQNLLSNAIKFTAEGVRPVIRLKVETFNREGDSESGSWWRIVLEDNGIGFDQRFAERIFTPFQRLHGRTEYSGSGIGLAVCRRVVERHGGNIRAESSPGVGTKFTVELPATQRKLLDWRV